MKIAILGGKGFIGGHLVDHYVNLGHEVFVWDNSSTGTYINPFATYFEHDLTMYVPVKQMQIMSECDVIIHLASIARVQPSFTDPTKYYTNNVGVVSTVLSQLEKENFQGMIIYTSTSSVYNGVKIGERATGSIEDSSKLYPMSPYAQSKQFAEMICNFYAKSLNIAIVRPFNIYGDRMSSTHGYATVLQIFLEQYKNGQDITVAGDGEQRRDFTHIQDFIQGLDLIIEKGCNDIYNIATHKNYTINTIANCFPFTVNIVKIPAGNEPFETKGSIAKLKRLGYSPKYDVIQWIESTIPSYSPTKQ